MKEKNGKSSPHILNASSNLLGLCFVVLTSLKLFNVAHKTVIDDLTIAATILFMASCILSFCLSGAMKKTKDGMNALLTSFFLED